MGHTDFGRTVLLHLRLCLHPRGEWAGQLRQQGRGGGVALGFCFLKRLEGGKGNMPLFAEGHGPISQMRKALEMNYSLLYGARYIVLLHIGGFFV